MSLNRYNPKRDANEAEICRALDTLGLVYYRLDRPVDLVVLHKGLWKLIEVKMPTGKLNRDQVEMFELCRDMGAQHLYVVRSVESLLEVLENG